MKKFVEWLNEAGFAVCVAIAIILAFCLMAGDVALKMAIRKRFPESFAKFLRKQRDLVPSDGPLAQVPKST